MNKDFSIAVMYAVTPCHAGSGSALGVVDLPIQRERHTNWPMIQASGVKGAFRANFDRFKNNIENKKQINDFSKLTDSVFGTSEGTGFAGSLSIGDARILAFPMRSNVSPFVWITCPAVLKRLEKDLGIAGFKSFNSSEHFVKDDDAISFGEIEKDKEVLLEDYEVKVSKKYQLPESIRAYFKDTERLLLVSDDVFNYGVSNCTQIMAQIKIDSKTGTTADGSLRYQEELPSDTLMYTVIHWGDTKNTAEDKLKAETIKHFVTDEVIKNHIQIAGDETCGRGVFQLSWFHSEKGGN
ncbi:MAG: type III-B CRISPR module RAMP protein Cmr4 [Spirochaetota bacterium]|nr:type III-B CRISPR module RAMP protein Cmr4 [Spirochaetota bacterium]